MGMIDEFRVWNKTLTAAKIRIYAAAPIANIRDAEQNDGLVLYYQFNQSSGNCIDATSYGNEGVRLGFGPDGDAWSESRGVFAINLDDFPMVGGMLNQTFYRVIDTTDSDVAKVVDGRPKPSVIRSPSPSTEANSTKFRRLGSIRRVATT